MNRPPTERHAGSALEQYCYAGLAKDKPDQRHQECTHLAMNLDQGYAHKTVDDEISYAVTGSASCRLPAATVIIQGSSEDRLQNADHHLPSAFGAHGYDLPFVGAWPSFPEFPAWCQWSRVGIAFQRDSGS